jgi:lipoprotein-anchoring transpeptidase ErfK/SrfK
MSTTRKRTQRPRRSHQVGLALLISLVIVLIGGAVAAWALDGSKQDEIAEGVTIGGVDVGGMTADEARRQLNSQLLQPLKKPIRVTYDEQSWELPAKDLKVRGNIAAAVEEAVRISREPSLPARVWRYVTGGSVDRSIAPEIRYSKRAVNEFVREVAGAVRVEPVDAGVHATGSSVEVVEAKDGVALRDRLLAKQIHRSITEAKGARVFAAKTVKIEPEVTTAEAAKKYPVYITVDRSTFQLKLWKNLKLAKTYTIAVGQVGMDTPAGLYTIQNKAVNPSWHVPNSDWAGDLAGQVIPPGPSNPIKARWMGIYDGAGIHGTSEEGSLGSAASHGCIRMSVPDVIELYDQVPVGTPIYIA